MSMKYLMLLIFLTGCSSTISNFKKDKNCKIIYVEDNTFKCMKFE